MTIINPTLPTVGDQRGNEEVDVRAFLQALLADYNGSISFENLAAAAVRKSNLFSDVPIVPTGAIMPYAGPAAPTGWLFCDGGAGTGDGTGTLNGNNGQPHFELWKALTNNGASALPYGGTQAAFTLPDLRGRVAVGKGTHAEVDALTDNDGLAVGSRKIKHKHGRGSLSIDGTASGLTMITGAETGGSVQGIKNSGSATAASAFTTPYSVAHGHNTSGEIGDTGGPLDSPAYQVLNHIIRT